MMKQVKLKVGDRVVYEQTGEVNFIEKQISDGVFFIGNKDHFCDVVPAHMLKLVGENIKWR